MSVGIQSSLTKETWYSQQYMKPFLPTALVPLLSITRITVKVSIKKTDSTDPALWAAEEEMVK